MASSERFMPPSGNEGFIMSDNHKESPPHSRIDDPALTDEEYDPLAEYEPYAVTSTRPEASALQVHTARRPDWEPGHPCPHCGSTLIVASYIGTEIARHRGGAVERLTTGERFGVVEYQCADCETVLYEDVAFDLWTTLHLD